MSPILSFFVPCSTMDGQSDTDEPDSGVLIFYPLFLFLTIEFPVLLKKRLPCWMWPEKVVIK